MRHRNMEAPHHELPAGVAELQRKHEAQIDQHELRYGKLGELMSKEQKRRLKADLAKQAQS